MIFRTYVLLYPPGLRHGTPLFTCPFVAAPPPQRDGYFVLPKEKVWYLEHVFLCGAIYLSLYRCRGGRGTAVRG
jgi:hypothetical protein